MAYNPNVQVNDATSGTTISNVSLYHVWPEGNVAELFSCVPDTKTGPVNSGAGGYDYWTLTFNISGSTALQAMSPAVAQIGQNNDPTQTIIFTIEGDHQVSIVNPAYTNPPAQTWGPLANAGFMAAGDTGLVAAPPLKEALRATA
jgi:hypothetical protein